jgi:hypothetical protein
LNWHLYYILLFVWILFVITDQFWNWLLSSLAFQPFQYHRFFIEELICF